VAASEKRKRAQAHASVPSHSIGAVLGDALQVAQRKGNGKAQASRGAAAEGAGGEGSAPPAVRDVTPPVMRGTLEGGASPAEMSSGGRSPPPKRSGSNAAAGSRAVDWSMVLDGAGAMDAEQTGGSSSAAEAAATMPPPRAAPGPPHRQLPPVPRFQLPAEPLTPSASQPSSAATTPKLPPTPTASQPSTSIATPVATPKPPQAATAPPCRQLPPVPRFPLPGAEPLTPSASQPSSAATTPKLPPTPTASQPSTSIATPVATPKPQPSLTASQLPTPRLSDLSASVAKAANQLAAALQSTPQTGNVDEKQRPAVQPSMRTRSAAAAAAASALQLEEHCKQPPGFRGRVQASAPRDEARASAVAKQRVKRAEARADEDPSSAGFSAFFKQQSTFAPLPSGQNNPQDTRVRANVVHASQLRATIRSVLWEAAVNRTLPWGQTAQLEHLGTKADESITLDSDHGDSDEEGDSDEYGIVEP